jgi:hypothetical protein
MQKQYQKITAVLTVCFLISMACSITGSPIQSPPITQIVQVTQIVPVTQIVSNQVTQIVPVTQNSPILTTQTAIDICTDEAWNELSNGAPVVIQNIGPADSEHDVIGAKPIWGQDDSPNSSTILIRSFTIPNNASNISGSITFLADDGATIFLNSVEVGNYDAQVWPPPLTLPLTNLQTGNNQIRAEVYNRPTLAWFEACAHITYTNSAPVQTTIEICTDETWNELSNGSPVVIQDIGPADSEHDVIGAKPIWGQDDSPNSSTILIRSFTIPNNASNISGSITFLADDGATIFLNSVEVGNYDAQVWPPPLTLPLTNLQTGNNQIRAEVYNRPTLAWLEACMQITYTSAK